MSFTRLQKVYIKSEVTNMITLHHTSAEVIEEVTAITDDSKASSDMLPRFCNVYHEILTTYPPEEKKLFAGIAHSMMMELITEASAMRDREALGGGIDLRRSISDEDNFFPQSVPVRPAASENGTPIGFFSSADFQRLRNIQIYDEASSALDAYIYGGPGGRPGSNNRS